MQMTKRLFKCQYFKSTLYGTRSPASNDPERRKQTRVAWAQIDWLVLICSLGQIILDWTTILLVFRRASF